MRAKAKLQVKIAKYRLVLRQYEDERIENPIKLYRLDCFEIKNSEFYRYQNTDFLNKQNLNCFPLIE